VASIALALPIDMVFARLTKVLIEGVIKDGLISRALQAVISRGDKALGVYSLKLVGLDEVKKYIIILSLIKSIFLLEFLLTSFPFALDPYQGY
jgi:hypothetical protein